MTALCDRGYSVSLETSGALDVSQVDPRVSRIVDIKTPGSGEVEKNLWANLAQLNARDEIKFVLCDEADYAWAKNQLDTHKLADICPVLFSPVYATLPAATLAGWILRDQLPVLIQKLDVLISPVLQAWGIDVRLDVEGLKAFVREHLSGNLGDGAARMLSSLKLGGSLVLAVLGHAVLVPVALYYLLLSWPRLIARLRSALPVAWRLPVGRFLTECDQVMGGYLRGQIAVMVAMA